MKRQKAMNWEGDNSFGDCQDDTDHQQSEDVEDNRIDLRQTAAGSLIRMAKRVGGYAYDQKSRNFTDTLASATFVAQWSTPLLLNGLIPGTGGSQRIGREIVIDLIHLRAVMVSPARLVLVMDHQSNGSAPAITDIWQTDTYESEINWSNRDRFEILLDTVLPINGDQHFEHTLNCSYLVNYNAGSAGTVADIASGALYFMINNSTTTASGTYLCGLRLEYEE